ncbi:MAG: hypothetical protein SO046_03020 [Actinomyces urogenitalis]|uniref:hypothetical protein n=1 Tax=Actinomyces urogenitalis TaxID=103621 RepID=UPI002A835702|nr:hypothetical protein [Actinomyces urogenitalis]MDY3678176.1 hypothetical protein [Actinomyces urogenitalis]
MSTHSPASSSRLASSSPLSSLPPRSAAPTWTRGVYWAALAAAWLVWLPNLLQLHLPDGGWSPLFVLSPLLGLVALATALWTRAWGKAALALVLGVGTSWILVTGSYLIEMLLASA